MNSRKLIWTKRFSKDVKQAKKRNQNLESLQKLIKMLQLGNTLSQECKLHPLKGKYSGYMECHIEQETFKKVFATCFLGLEDSSVFVTTTSSFQG